MSHGHMLTCLGLCGIQLHTFLSYCRKIPHVLTGNFIQSIAHLRYPQHNRIIVRSLVLFYRWLRVAFNMHKELHRNKPKGAHHNRKGENTIRSHYSFPK